MIGGYTSLSDAPSSQNARPRARERRETPKREIPRSRNQNNFSSEARPIGCKHGQQTSLGPVGTDSSIEAEPFWLRLAQEAYPTSPRLPETVARQRWPRARNRQRARRVLSWYATHETSKSSFSTSRRCSSASTASSNPFEFCGRSTTTPRPRTRTCSGSVWRRRSSRSRPTRARSRPRTAWAATTCERRSVEGRRRPYERPRIRATGAAWPSRSSA